MQVQKHAEKLQYAKEQSALAALTGVLPGLGKAVYAIALQELDWDPTLAAQLLLQFQQAKANEWQDVKKVCLAPCYYSCPRSCQRMLHRTGAICTDPCHAHNISS